MKVLKYRKYLQDNISKVAILKLWLTRNLPEQKLFMII